MPNQIGLMKTTFMIDSANQISSAARAIAIIFIFLKPQPISK